jgi:tetratricopeptide (TPR) repeat protein
MYQEAFSSGSLAIEMDPDNVRAYLLRASALKQMHEYEAARADLRVILRLDPAHKEATQMLEELPRRDLGDLVTVSGVRDLIMVPGTPTGLSHNNKLEEEPEAEHTEGTHELGNAWLPSFEDRVLVQKNAQSPSRGDHNKFQEEPEAEHTEGTHELEGLPSPLTALRKRYADASLDKRNNNAQLMHKQAHADQKEAAQVLEV